MRKIKPSATLVINEKSKELSKQGKKIFNFGFGQSPFPIPSSVVETLKNNAHKKEYLPIQGLKDLKMCYLKKSYQKNWSKIFRGKHNNYTRFKRSNVTYACCF